MERDEGRSAAPPTDTHGPGTHPADPLGTDTRDAAGPARPRDPRARWWPWTATGTRLLGIAAALLAAAWPLGYPEAAVLGGAALLTTLGALAWALPPRRISAARVVVPARVARGDPAEAVVTLVNRGRRVLRRLALEDRCGGRPVPVEVTRLAPDKPGEARYGLPTDRRGRVVVGPLRVVRADPLGLTRRASVCAGETTLLVRPRVHPLPLLASGRAHHIEGPNSATADGGSQTFHALRGYVLGDDLRRVHWRSSARTGELMVRQMVDVSMPHTTVVLDTRSAAYDAARTPESRDTAERAFELAVETAASVACAVLLRRFPLRLLGAAGCVLAESRHSLTPDELLDALAVVEFTGERSLAAAFDAVDRARVGGTLVVVSGSHDLTGVRELARLADRFERTVVVRAAAPGHAAERGTSERPAAGRGGPDGPGTVPRDIPCLPVDGPDSLVSAWRREAVR
ncbi:DUF58 domain-containing protein [Yinghuangia sp. ASG 101]|uniref:DUF58 domain-containing protein n=1 Tax=Yinghuangia sp. ASG 101 TaxID=2896848 RepID=UPI001E29E436|nr:DUF58 domain-containing protein [Yinghuangia sp. ASG 101]UGQ10368.1 DUF58 domain-containing protein [Yinghuangia sp. ASG 101]